MVEMKVYEPGTPSWCDLGSADVAASTKFYGGLFGWKVQDMGPEAGGYGIFLLRGKRVAGCGPLQEGQPPSWSTYVSVADADATVAAAKGAGATVLVEPMDVMDVGRMAIFVDPTGAVISIWQPRAHIGAELVNEPGAMCWNELATRDIETAKSFYGAVFGWKGDTTSMGPMTYTEWKLGERTVGGMMEMGAQIPAQVPPHWLAYIAVADCDAAIAKAQKLGASVMVPATDIPAGRFSVLGDPQGATFGIIALTP